MVEISDVATALGIVIERVDHDFAGQRRHRNVSQALQRDRDDDDVTRLRGFLGRGGARVPAELGDKIYVSPF